MLFDYSTTTIKRCRRLQNLGGGDVRNHQVSLASGAVMGMDQYCPKLNRASTPHHPVVLHYVLIESRRVAV